MHIKQITATLSVVSALALILVVSTFNAQSASAYRSEGAFVAMSFEDSINYFKVHGVPSSNSTISFNDLAYNNGNLIDAMWLGDLINENSHGWNGLSDSQKIFLIEYVTENNPV